MVRPSVPNAREAQEHRYTFVPMPMDEPPMDARTFNHYFHKPHLADDSATWIARFPQLLDASLFYGSEKLAKGWGVEIVEDRNWVLFVGANVLLLLVSGLLAALYACVADDRQTGVALGAWLTAVQGLGTTALFLRWTGG